MERSYPKRYNKPWTEGLRGLVARGLGPEAGDVRVEGEVGPDRAEVMLVDDFSLYARGETGTRGTRVDVLYIDEEFGVVRLVGPVGGERYDEIPEPAADAALPVPLPVLLWRSSIEAGVWVVVSSLVFYPEGWSGDGRCARRLVRVTEAVLERGRQLDNDLAWCRGATA